MEVVRVTKKTVCTPQVINPAPPGPLRNEEEFYSLIAEVWLRKQKRIAEEALVSSKENAGA